MLFSLHDQYEFQENTALLNLPAENKYVNCKTQITSWLKNSPSKFLDQLSIDMVWSVVRFGSKIIELSSTELQKLQFELQKTSQQNWQLARANSHMLGVDSLSIFFIVSVCKQDAFFICFVFWFAGAQLRER